MKLLLITTFIVGGLSAGFASATTNDCKRQGGGYVCGPTNIYVDGSKAQSEAEAHAYATAKQEQEQAQLQGQAQGQTQTSSNSNDNSNSSSITNTIEGAPKFTASANLGLNISLPIASGVQTSNAINTANWLVANGYPAAACAVMQKAPRVRNSGIKINCGGDRG
jgi:hypothetical protein